MPVEHITDPDDARLDPFRHLQRAQIRGRSGQFIAEGRFVVERLIASRFPVESILLTKQRFARLRSQLPDDDTAIYVVPRSIVKQLVGFDFHAGILACGVRQPLADLKVVLRNVPDWATFAVCPRTTDPVNLGTIIRLSCAFGVHALLLGQGCADPFSRRVLRVSMGNVLRVPIIESADLAADLRHLHEVHSVELAALVLDPNATPLETVSPPPRIAVLFGHEGEGLAEEWTAFCDHRWTIPMSGGTDSLNVSSAAAIVLHHLARRIGPTGLDDNL